MSSPKLLSLAFMAVLAMLTPAAAQSPNLDMFECDRWCNLLPMCDAFCLDDGQHSTCGEQALCNRFSRSHTQSISRRKEIDSRVIYWLDEGRFDVRSTFRSTSYISGFTGAVMLLALDADGVPIEQSPVLKVGVNPRRSRTQSWSLDVPADRVDEVAGYALIQKRARSNRVLAGFFDGLAWIADNFRDVIVMIVGEDAPEWLEILLGVAEQGDIFADEIRYHADRRVREAFDQAVNDLAPWSHWFWR